MKKKSNKDKIIAELKSEVENLRAIISLMPGNVYWKNTKGIYLGCNRNLSEILQLNSPHEIIGKKDEDLLGKEMGQKANSIDPLVIKTKEEKCVEEHGFALDGSKAVYITRKTPLYDNQGRVRGILGVSFDITERKSIEKKLKIAKQKAQSANKAKSKFLAMISHELRTPLTSILGFADLLSKTDTSLEKKVEYIKFINESGNYLLSLISSLLDYTKLETKNFELLLVPTNIKELISNIISMFESSTLLRQLSLCVEYDTNIPHYIIADKYVLHQILINLISNAIKFTSKGFVRVKVILLKSGSIFSKLAFIVEDSGIGIPVKEQKNIFKQFYQIGNVYTRHKSLTGAGLGLSIVKKLVDLIGGDITLQSKKDKGSTFTFSANFENINADHNPWLPYATHVRLLVVQDFPKKSDVHLFLKHMLYEVIQSKDAISTLINAHQHMQPYDIVIIDNYLKYSTPYKLIKQIRKDLDTRYPMPVLINSEVKKASQFVLSFPLLATVSPTHFQQQLKHHWEKWQAMSKSPSPFLQNAEEPYVLLVEDNNMIQIIHRQMLEDLGCKVDVTDSATNALTKLVKNYDLLFIDIGLPDIAGFELIRQIRSLPNSMANIPIIVLTGFSAEEERYYCLSAGANAVSIKPISQDTFKSLINRYYQRKDITRTQQELIDENL